MNDREVVATIRGIRNPLTHNRAEHVIRILRKIARPIDGIEDLAKPGESPLYRIRFAAK